MCDDDRCCLLLMIMLLYCYLSCCAGYSTKYFHFYNLLLLHVRYLIVDFAFLHFRCTKSSCAAVVVRWFDSSGAAILLVVLPTRHAIAVVDVVVCLLLFIAVARCVSVVALIVLVRNLQNCTDRIGVGRLRRAWRRRRSSFLMGTSKYSAMLAQSGFGTLIQKSQTAQLNSE